MERCVFPLGNPGEPGFGFCGEPTVGGRPYCAHHCRVAYVGHHERQRVLLELEMEIIRALRFVRSKSRAANNARGAPELTAEQLAAQ